MHATSHIQNLDAKIFFKSLCRLQVPLRRPQSQPPPPEDLAILPPEPAVQMTGGYPPSGSRVPEADDIKRKIEKRMPRVGQKSCPGRGKNRSGGEFSLVQAQIILPPWPILVLCPCLQQFKAPVKNVKILKNSGTPGLRSVDRQARGLSRAPRPGRLGGRAL